MIDIEETNLFAFENEKTDENLSQKPRKTLHGKEILPKPQDYNKAYLFALGLITRQRRTEKQLVEKMQFHLYQEVDIEAVVAYFKSKKWIDDKSFAEDYIDSRKAKKGIFNLCQELIKKGISKEIIAEVSAQYKEKNSKEDLREIAENALLKKFKSLEQWKKSSDYFKKYKPKVIRYMQSKGFGYEFYKHLL